MSLSIIYPIGISVPSVEPKHIERNCIRIS